MIYPLIPLVDEGVDTLVSSNTIVGEVQVHKAYDDTEARHQVYSGNICLQGNILEDRHCRLIVNFMATRPMTPCYCLFSFFEHVVALTRSKEGAFALYESLPYRAQNPMETVQPPGFVLTAASDDDAETMLLGYVSGRCTQQPNIRNRNGVSLQFSAAFVFKKPLPAD
jgi:hypothetical protein